MTVRDLINHLLDCRMDDKVVVQLNHGDGYFSHHDLLIQKEGHPAFSGPVIHHGMQLEDESKEANCYCVGEGTDDFTRCPVCERR